MFLPFLTNMFKIWNFSLLFSKFDLCSCNLTGGPQPLSWPVRMKVAIGAARGLSFLHNAKSQVIYRDFKASNILLDAVRSLRICNLIYNFRIFVNFLLIIHLDCRSLIRNYPILAWLKRVLPVTELTCLLKLWVLKDMQHLNMLQLVYFCFTYTIVIST